MRRSLIISIAVLSGIVTSLALFSLEQPAFAHCEVPCGIYNDHARIVELYEDAATIEKAMRSINDLAGGHDAQSANQLGRWISTKEAHATHAMETISQYFLAQRVKPVTADADGHDRYLDSLARHHAVLVAAMKCKQSADPQRAADLVAAINGIAGDYPAATPAYLPAASQPHNHGHGH